MKSVLFIFLFMWHCSFVLHAQSIQKNKIISGVAKANGLHLAYEIFGPGHDETIILINGTGAQLIDWPIEICEGLAKKGYRVIRFDNRDVGLSSKLYSLGDPDWAAIIPKIKTCDNSGLSYTIGDMAKDAVGLLDALKIQKAHVVGVSMGGAIAQVMAINYPGRVLSLTCIASSSGNPNLPQGDPKVLAIMAAPPPNNDNLDARVAYLFNMYKAMQGKGQIAPDSSLRKTAKASVERSWYPAGAARQAAAIIIGDNCDRRDQLKTISVPTVIIHGKADPVVNVEAAKELTNSIKNSKQIILQGMGHAFSESVYENIIGGILLAAKQ